MYNWVMANRRRFTEKMVQNKSYCYHLFLLLSKSFLLWKTDGISRYWSCKKKLSCNFSRLKLRSTKLLLARSENTQIVDLRMGIGVKYQPILFTYLSQLFLVYISWKQVLCPLRWCIICVDCTTKSLGMTPCTFHMCVSRVELPQIHTWKVR